MAKVEIGYTIACEEHRPLELVRYGCRAEQAGMPFAMISDHFHPWTERQGNSPFVWSVIGALAQATQRIRIGTAVTCPTVRMHPAIVAQAAATSAAMLPGRFMLGVGTGEHLNEHILGDRWPPAAVRREMLEEAVAVIRRLWTGEEVEHHGMHYTVENARIYSLPERPPPVLVAASGPEAARLAAAIGDGFIGTAPEEQLIAEFEGTADAERPRCELIACGPDPERHVEVIRRYVDAGYDHLFLHQVGPDQEGFFDFYERELRSHIEAL